MLLHSLIGRLLFVTGATTMAGFLTVYALAKPATFLRAESATVAPVAPVASSNHQDPPDVPPAIEVPAGNRVFLVVHAIGTQNYTCNGSGAWGPAVPSANLFDKNGRLVGTHFGGPTWQYMDGSSVLGTRIAGVSVPPPPAPPVAIPWLLLQMVSTTTGPDGGDRLTDTTYIQRVHTTGGLAPAGACVTGTTASVPYTADYYFYRADTDGDDRDDD
jgi:hypothetical protein